MYVIMGLKRNGMQENKANSPRILSEEEEEAERNEWVEVEAAEVEFSTQ